MYNYQNFLPVLLNSVITISYIYIYIYIYINNANKWPLLSAVQIMYQLLNKY